VTSVEHVVVVGASLGGLRTAQSLRSVGFDGRITLIGDEHHKPYDRPPLSKQVLAGEWGTGQVSLAEDTELDKLQIDLRLGVRVTDLDVPSHSVGLHGGERVQYDALVIATGASPRMIPGTPNLRGIHVLRTLEHCLDIRAALERASSVVVVGAGFIGAEVAAVSRKRGLEVTVLEALPVPLSRGLGPTLGPVIAGIHADHGVDLRTGAGVAGFEGGDRVERVVLADGSTVAADVVVVGIGVVPNTQWLEGSGIQLRDGVVCDSFCQSVSAPNIYAVGDVARWHNDLFDEEMRIEHWTNGVEQAMAVANNIAGEKAPYTPVPYVWSDQYDSKIQIVGRPTSDDQVEVPLGAFDDRKFVALTHRDGRLTGAVGLDEPRKLMRFKRLLTTRPSFDEAMAVARELA
jgi:3-phenylpropionate/trans-cinnamate dioxygenase ferredoxin reductase component